MAAIGQNQESNVFQARTQIHETYLRRDRCRDGVKWAGAGIAVPVTFIPYLERYVDGHEVFLLLPG